MRNFIRFVARFFNLILFISLEALCAVLIARTNSLQGGDLLSSSNAVAGFLYKRQNALVYYFNLGAVNDSLLRENVRLREQMARIKWSTDTLRDSTGLARSTNPDSAHVVEYARYIFRIAPRHQ